jgi:iron only hydrogenase large subunit-like protein
MCCEGGCIGGNATMNNQRTAKKLIEQLSNSSSDIEKI